MKIDCARCPARGYECGDCMMRVFFDPATSEYASSCIDDPSVSELAAAVDVFADTELMSDAAAAAAMSVIHAGDNAVGGRIRRTPRAV